MEALPTSRAKAPSDEDSNHKDEPDPHHGQCNAGTLRSQISKRADQWNEQQEESAEPASPGANLCESLLNRIVGAVARRPPKPITESFQCECDCVGQQVTENAHARLYRLQRVEITRSDRGKQTNVIRVTRLT